MKNEKYIAPEMEVVNVKMDCNLMTTSYPTEQFPTIPGCGCQTKAPWEN